MLDIYKSINIKLECENPRGKNDFTIIISDDYLNYNISKNWSKGQTLASNLPCTLFWNIFWVLLSPCYKLQAHRLS